MLTCPCCRTPLTENAPRCPKCTFSVEGATVLLGPIPLLNRGISDLSQALNDSQRKKLDDLIELFERTFTGAQINLIIRSFDPRYSLSIHLFWLFNTTGLSPTEFQYEQNKSFLIGLDPSSGRIGLMLGYGLEPFIKQEEIDKILEQSKEHLEAGLYYKAISTLIKNIHKLMESAATHANKFLDITHEEEITGYY